MAVLTHRLECPLDVGTGWPDASTYTFDMPTLPATLGIGGLVGVEYKNGSFHILAICDRSFTILNPAISTTFTWRLEGQAPPTGLGVVYIGACYPEGTGDTIFWFKT